MTGRKRKATDSQYPLTHKQQRILSSWEASNPNQVREWKADGSLEQRLSEAVEQECEALAKADADGMTHLSDREKSELYGGPNLKL